MKVHEKLRWFIEEKNLTQSKVAADAGINLKTLNMMLNGHVRIPADTLVAICEKGLGVSPAYFFRVKVQ